MTWCFLRLNMKASTIPPSHRSITVTTQRKLPFGSIHQLYNCYPHLTPPEPTALVACLLIPSFREFANQLKVLCLAVGEDRSAATCSQRQVVAFLAWCLLKPAPTSPLILWHQQRTKPFSWLFVNSLHLSSCAPLILKKADIVMQSGSCYLSCKMK